MTWIHTQIELGWLATSIAARRDGFLPRYRNLKSDGMAIVDDWGSLVPDLAWRHGRGMGDPKLECAYAIELLKATFQVAIDSGVLKFRSESEAEFALQIVKLPGTLTELQSSVCIISNRIPEPYIRSAWLAALPTLIPHPFRLRLHRLEVDPALLLRTGYRMLLNEWELHGFARPETAEALAIFGLGALGLFPRWRCSVCFRLAVPGGTRCRIHSQAELLRLLEKKLHARNSSGARLGRQVVRELNWSSEEFLNPVPTDTEAEQKTVAGILWGMKIGRFNYSMEQLRNGLINGQFPRVQVLLGERFLRLNDGRAFAFLRAKLDPNEWIVSAWSLRVHAAELWLEAAAKLSPGRTQSQVAFRTLELVKEARALIDQGSSQKEVAGLLKIKPPYLSKLLKRIPPS